MICQCFIHGSSLTHKERALEIHHVDAYFAQTRHFPVQLLNMFQEIYVLAHHSYQGFWKRPKCPVYIGKNCLFLVSGKRKSRLMLCQIPWQRPTLSSLGCFQGYLLPPQPSQRNWKPSGEVTWGYVGKSWQKRPGEYKGNCFRRASTSEGEKMALHVWEVRTCFSKVLISTNQNFPFVTVTLTTYHANIFSVLKIHSSVLTTGFCDRLQLWEAEV